MSKTVVEYKSSYAIGERKRKATFNSKPSTEEIRARIGEFAKIINITEEVELKLEREPMICEELGIK